LIEDCLDEDNLKIVLICYSAISVIFPLALPIEMLHLRSVIGCVPIFTTSIKNLQYMYRAL